MRNAKLATRFRRQEHVDKITVFVDSDFAGDQVSRKGMDGIGGADWRAHNEIWIHTSVLGSAAAWEKRKFYAAVKRM